ncbi:MAG: type II secretion system F family protein [Candidatus Magasanikbacteria bacterium]|jgi:type IV pilus assembly protein PilC
MSNPKTPSVLEQKINEFFYTYIFRIPFPQKMQFAHHLQIMTKAGLSIVAGLKILSQEIENPQLKKIIAEIKSDVEKGQQLSEALGRHPRVFPPIYVNMVAAGESAGKMEDALANIHNQMQKSHELSSKIRGAMIYPAVILVAMGGIAVEIVFFVLPKLMTMFQEFNAELPLPTRILIVITNTAQNFGLYIFVALIGLVILTIYLLKQPAIKKIVHAGSLHLPIFGAIIRKINLASFTISLSSLLKSGIPIIDAVKTTATVQSNVIYRDALLIVAEQLKKGETISKILQNYPKLFPAMVTEMIMVGEETGQVEQMLAEMAEYYANEVDQTMKNFSTIIEPVIILTLGLATAGIAVAVIMPMYSLAQSF